MSKKKPKISLAIRETKRRYYLRNKVMLAEKSRKYWVERCKDPNFLPAQRKRRHKFRKNNQERLLIYACRKRARELELEFNLVLGDIKIPKRCPALGIKIVPTFFGKRNKNSSPSVDRINNKKGYTKDNIIVVSFRANWLKNDGTVTELRRLANFYTNLENKI